jgi:hypothetical protein
MIETSHPGTADTTVIHLSIKHTPVGPKSVLPEGHVQLSLSLQDGRSYKVPIYFGKAVMNQGDGSGATREDKQATKEAAEP